METKIIFYKEKRFKETPIGKIPKDWKIEKLEKVVSLCQSGIWGDDPVPGEISYPVIRSTEITHDGKIDLSTVALRKIPKNKITRYQLQDGDILVVSSSGSSHLIGRVALFHHPNDGRVYLFSNFMIRLRPKNTDSRFLYYFLNSTSYYSFLRSLQQTSTGLRNLSKKKLLQLNIPLPLLEEQKAIAHVLSTVDKAIQKTNEIIEKIKRLKKGLMQELLTKGIRHKEFKNTEIGRIPKEWKVVRLEELIDLKSGQYFKYSEFRSSGVRCFKIDNVGFGEILWETVTFLPKNYLEKYPELVLNPSDIVIALNRPIINGKIKVGMLGEEDCPSILYQRVGKIILKNKTRMDKRYLFFVLMGEYFKQQLYRSLIGTDQPYIRTPSFLRIRIALPPFNEQKKIAEILSTVNKMLEVEKKKRRRLKRIKKAMMNLLLTGKIRVKVR